MLEHVAETWLSLTRAKSTGMFLSFQTMEKAPFQDFSGTDVSIFYGACATTEVV